MPTVALSHHVKIRELLTSGVVFAVKYECLIENKNIRTFCGCKPSKKKTSIEPHQSFTGCYEKHGGYGLTPIHRIWKVKEGK